MIEKILFIDIDVERDQGSTSQYRAQHPIGLMYLAAATKKEYPDIQSKIFHTAVSHQPLQELESIVRAFKPDLIGLRALSKAQTQFHKVIEKLTEIGGTRYVIAGGPYPSSSCKEILQLPMIDLVVLGEGEATLIDLLGRLRKTEVIPPDVEGTAVMVDGILRVNSPRAPIMDIDSIPFPDYSLIAFEDYAGISNSAHHDVPEYALICSSRGCPYQCIYCHKLFGKKVRRRSAKNVVEEMRTRIEQNDIRTFVFTDDIFNVPMDAAKETLALIAKELPPVQLCFPNGLRSDHLDTELLDHFERAGTTTMALAVETATPRLQKLIGKNLNLEKAKRGIKEASERFAVTAFFIIGFPTETMEEAKRTIEFAKELDCLVDPLISILRVYENTPLFKILNPTPEQIEGLRHQELAKTELEIFAEPNFYGNLFSKDKVPLKGNDIKQLGMEWFSEVINNKNRIKKSYSILQKHFTQKQIIKYYQNIYNNSSFNENTLKALVSD